MKYYSALARKAILSWLVWVSGLSAVCEPKGHWFESQPGLMPGTQARSPGAGV